MKSDSSIPGLLALLALALAVLAILLFSSCHRTEVHADGAQVDVHIHLHVQPTIEDP